MLPNYSILHKQDIFITEKYEPDIRRDELSFLSRSFERHFNERPYLLLPAALVLYIGLSPGPLLSMISPSITNLLNDHRDRGAGEPSGAPAAPLWKTLFVSEADKPAPPAAARTAEGER